MAMFGMAITLTAEQQIYTVIPWVQSHIVAHQTWRIAFVSIAFKVSAKRKDVEERW